MGYMGRMGGMGGMGRMGEVGYEPKPPLYFPVFPLERAL